MRRKIGQYHGFPPQNEEAAAAAETPPSIGGDARPRPRNRVVARTLRALQKGALDDRGAVKSGAPGEFRVRCHPTALQRVGDLLGALVDAMKERGAKLVAEDLSASFEVDGEHVTALLSEVIRRTRHTPTPSEERALERWRNRHGTDLDRWGSLPVVAKWDFMPTGELSLEIGRWPRPPSATHVFKDSRSRKLEERFDDIVASFVAHAEFQRVLRAREADRRRAAELRREADLHRASEHAREQARQRYLDKKLTVLRELRDLRELLDRLRVSEGGTGQAPFISWARARLGDLERQLGGTTIEEETAHIDAFQG